MSDQNTEGASRREAGAASVVLANRYELNPSQSRPQFDSPGAQAFAATDIRGGRRPLLAFVCSGEIGIRLDCAAALMRLPQVPLLAPIELGKAYWPPVAGYRPILITSTMAGTRVVADEDEPFTPWSEDRVFNSLLRPLLPVFREMSERHITHRAVRASNLFHSDKAREEVVLGECVTSLPAMHQPLIYEPIDSAMAMPSGRGDGTPADDFYALGVLVLVLLAGGNPVANLSDDEMIDSKIAVGSYSTLAGKARISLPMAELLRGLLCDDVEERWQTQEVAVWLDGRHGSPKQPALAAKAARTLAFEGQDYLTGPGLSRAMGRNWRSAIDLARTPEIEKWVRRSLCNEDQAEAIVQAAREWSSDAAGSNEIMLAHTLICLDPSAPLRLQDLAARVDGLGSALAANFHDERLRGLFHRLLASRLPHYWLAMQPHSRPDLFLLCRSLDQAGQDLRYGGSHAVFQVLYDLNPGWPCQSPLLKPAYVIRIDELVPALEQVAGNADPESEPVDLHIAVFAAARSKMTLGVDIGQIVQHEDEPVRRLAMLKMLSEIQKLYSKGAAPALAQWFARLLGPQIQTYHNRTIRSQLEREVDKVARSGNLEHLLITVNNPAMRQQDERGFAMARETFARNAEEVSWLKGGALINPSHIKPAARRAASVASSILAGISLLVMTMVYAF